MLLGAKIGLLAVGFFGGIFLSGCGFKRAGDAAEPVHHVGKGWCVPVGLWLALYIGGAILAGGSVTYGLSLWLMH